MPTHNIMVHFLIIIFILCTANPKTIKLPLVQQSSVLQLKYAQTSYLRIPQFPLPQVSRRTVSKVGNNQNESFKPCWSIAPSMTFNRTDRILFDGVTQRPLLIFKFEDIQYSQNVLDAYHEGQEIYIFFQDGTVAHVEISASLKIKSHKMLRASGMGQNEKIESGFFAKVGKQLVFASEKYAFRVTDATILKLQGYEPSQRFESAISINDKYFGVVYQEAIKLYKFNGDKLQVADTYNVINPETEFFKDMIFYEQKNALLVIDQFNGVLWFDVDVNSELPKLTGQKEVLFDGKYCEMLNINKQTKVLHVLCERVYDFDLSTWPKLELILYHYSPGVRVKEIYSFDSLTAFVGVDAFMITYWNQKAAYYEDKNLDRLIFTSKFFITVNQGNLIIGKYWVQDPEIKCSFQQPELLGDHELIFETYAGCSLEFFLANNISKSQYKYEQGDICLYSIKQTVHVWKPGHLKLLEIQIGFSIIFGAILIVIIGIVIRKIMLKRAHDAYQFEISELKETLPIQNGESGKHIQLNEQMSENPPNDSKEQLGNDVIESKEEFETGKKAEYEI